MRPPLGPLPLARIRMREGPATRQAACSSLGPRTRRNRPPPTPRPSRPSSDGWTSPAVPRLVGAPANVLVEPEPLLQAPPYGVHVRTPRAAVWSTCAHRRRGLYTLAIATARRHTFRRRTTDSGSSALTPPSGASISMWTRARLRSESRYSTHRPCRALLSLATQVSNSPKKAVRVANVRCCCGFKLRRWPWGRQTATANGTVHSRWRSDWLIERVVGGTGLEPVTSCL